MPDDARAVLDLACGDGPLLLAILERLGTRVDLIGIDVSAVDLELARGHLAAVGARLLCEDARTLSLPEASVDAVVCHYALMLMRPIETVLTEVARVIRPGGTFVACVPGGTSIDRNTEETRALLLEVIRNDVPTYPDTGLGDRRVYDDAATKDLLTAAGFDAPTTEVVTVMCELTPETTLEQMRDYYWWDMIREESRARLERELPPMLMRQAGVAGTIRQETGLRMIIARRR